MIKIGDKKYMTIQEYATDKMVTIQTVYNRIKNKEIKSKKIYNQTFIEV